MNDKILQEVKQQFAVENGWPIWEDVVLKGEFAFAAVDAIAVRYHERMKQEEAKSEQKQHIVELTRLGDEPEAGWIKTDRMPDYDGQYLVFIVRKNECGTFSKYQRVIECFMNRWVLNDESERVTHWMMLPGEPEKSIKLLKADEPEVKECFPKEEVNGLIQDYGAGEYGAKSIHKYLNQKSNQYAEERIMKSLEKSAENLIIKIHSWIADFTSAKWSDRLELKQELKSIITSKDNYQ